MTAPAALLHLEGVEKWYGSRRVLAVDDLMFHEGDRIELTGRNGSGKTTLLKLIARVTPATRGSIKWAPNGAQITGYVAQSGGLYTDLSISENLALRSRLYGSALPQERLFALARDFGLTAFLNRRFSELSGGYQRLSCIACAVATSPSCLFLDEPFNGLESDHVDLVLSYLAGLKPPPRILIVASPDSNRLPGATRRIEVVNGRVLCEAP